MRYPTGQPVRLSTSVRDLSGTLVNAGALSLVLLRPDNTQQIYSSPTNDGTGLYHQDVPATDMTQLGHYQYKWVATGVGAGVSAGAFDVYDPFEQEVLSLADLKTQIGIPLTDTSKDAELEMYAATAIQAIEDLIGGPYLNRTITELVYPCEDGRALILREQRVVSITAIVDMQSGSSVSVSQLILDPVTRILRQKLWVPFYWVGPFQVTYVAGCGTAVSPSVNTAARIIGQHLWLTRRGAASLPGIGGQDPVVITPSGFAVPSRAVQLLAGLVEEAAIS